MLESKFTFKKLYDKGITNDNNSGKLSYEEGILIWSNFGKK